MYPYTAGDKSTFKVGKFDVLQPVERVSNRPVLPIGAACSQSMQGFLNTKREKHIPLQEKTLSSTFYAYLLHEPIFLCSSS